MTTTASPPEKTDRRGSKRTKTPAPQLPTPVRKQRRWPLVGLGLALLAASVFGVNALMASASKTVEVVALASNVTRGEALQLEDLIAVQLPVGQAGLSSVPGDQIDSLVGQVAAADLVAGTTLAPASVVAEITPRAGYSIVGAALSIGQLPAQPLHAGDTVRVVDTPVSQGDPPLEPPQEFAATIVSVSTDTAGTTLIDLEVAQDQAAQVAVRAFTGRMVLVLDPIGS